MSSPQITHARREVRETVTLTRLRSVSRHAINVLGGKGSGEEKKKNAILRPCKGEICDTPEQTKSRIAISKNILTQN